MRFLQRVFLGLTLACAAVGAAQAQGQGQGQTDWPHGKIIRLVVPFAAGGSSDICARLIGRQMQATTGQNFVVENLAGGNGVVGTLAVLQAPQLSARPGSKCCRTFLPKRRPRSSRWSPTSTPYAGY